MQIESFLFLAVLLAIAAHFSAHTDQKAEDLIKQIQAASVKVHTFTADVHCEFKSTADHTAYTAFIQLKKPDCSRIAYPGFIIITNSEYSFRIDSDGSRYSLTRQDPRHPSFATGGFEPIEVLQDPISPLGRKMTEMNPRYVGEETIEGTTYRVLELSERAPMLVTTRLYVAPNNLVTRSVSMVDNAEKQQIIMHLANVKINAPIDPGAFVITIPKTAQREKQSTTEELMASFLPVGQRVPSFVLSTPTGDKIALDQILRGKKALLIHFWSFG